MFLSFVSFFITLKKHEIIKKNIFCGFFLREPHSVTKKPNGILSGDVGGQFIKTSSRNDNRYMIQLNPFISLCINIVDIKNRRIPIDTHIPSYL